MGERIPVRLDQRRPVQRWLSSMRKARSGRFFLAIFSCGYGLLVQARYALYRLKILRARRLPFKVVCVGNLTLGGTGKTPMVEYAARILQEAGIRVAILSRGYKGRHEKGLGVVSDGERMLLAPKESGDEPYLLARHLRGVPVLVGRNRYLSGRMAHDRFGTEVAILDDGFQHIQLHRDMNILVVDGRHGFGDGQRLGQDRGIYC